MDSIPPHSPPTALSSADDTSLLQSYLKTPSLREQAFGELVRRYLPLVLGAAWRRLNSRPLAEEAAMNAFTKLAMKARKGRVPGDRLAGWLHRTAVLEASNLARTESRFSREIPQEIISLTEQNPADMNQHEIFEKLDAALHDLAEVDQELILRRYTFGETVREIAEKIGKSEEACQKRLERALARLGAKLGTSVALVAVLKSTAAKPAGAAEVVLQRKITAEALAQASEVTASAWWGTVAACVTAATLAATLAWPKQAPTTASVATPQRVAPALSPQPSPAAVPLKPRPALIPRTLADVLDSVQCGRVLPLLEFLPQATVADLQAFLREDDMSSLSERSMQRRGTDYLVLARWVALDAAGAWKYAVSRDKDNNGYTYPLAAYAFVVWAKQDSVAAWNAAAALTRMERNELAGALSGHDDSLTEELIARYPEVYWHVQQHRSYNTTPAKQAAQAQKSVEAALRGEDRHEDAYRLANALLLVAEGDADVAITQAMMLPTAGQREALLDRLYTQFPEKVDPASLPLGKTRLAVSKARYAKADQPMPTDPQMQKVWLEAMGPKLAYHDPFRLFDLMASAKPSGKELHTYEQRGDESDRNWLEAAVETAAKQDAQKTKAALPGIRSLVPDYIYNELERVIQNTKNP